MKTKDLLCYFSRSLFIMASLNFRRMQNLGFAYAILPLAGRIIDKDDNISPFLMRHLEYFNTHPFLSGAVLGSVIRLEEDKHAETAHEEGSTERLKKSLMGPYAAIGDSFFWGSLRPFAGIVAGIMAYAGIFWAAFVFLLIFDPLHLWIRIKGFIEGYRQGWQGIIYIQSWELPRLARYLRWVSLLILAASAACIGSSLSFFPSEGTKQLIFGIPVLAMVLISYYSIRRGLSPIIVIYCLTAFSVFIMV